MVDGEKRNMGKTDSMIYKNRYLKKNLIRCSFLKCLYMWLTRIKTKRIH